MAELQPKDKVEWRAGDTPSKSHLRKGVVKEVIPLEGVALVRTKVEGESVIERIGLKRLRKIEEPPKKRGRRKGAKKAGKRGRPRGRKSAKKRAAA